MCSGPPLGGSPTSVSMGPFQTSAAHRRAHMPYELVPRKPQHPRMPPRWSAQPAPLTDQESYGFLVHEIRNLVNTAIVACEVMNVGKGASRDDAGRILKRSLSGLRQRRQHRVAFVVGDLVDELTSAAPFEAEQRGLHLTVRRGGGDAVVHADR